MGKIQTDSNPEDELLKHCKNSIIKNFNLYTVKKNLKTNVFPTSWKQKEISQKNLRI